MPTFDDLRISWEHLTSETASRISPEQARDQVAKHRRDTFLRDFLLIGPLVLISLGGVFFNVVARDGVPLSTLIANLLPLGLALVVALSLWRARRGNARDDRTLLSRLDGDIARVKRQIHLLWTAWFWFVLPMQGVILVSSLAGHHERTGSFVPGAKLWAFYFADALLVLTTIWLCRREARRKLGPLLASLYTLRRDLTGNER